MNPTKDAPWSSMAFVLSAAAASGHRTLTPADLEDFLEVAGAQGVAECPRTDLRDLMYAKAGTPIEPRASSWPHLSNEDARTLALLICDEESLSEPREMQEGITRLRAALTAGSGRGNPLHAAPFSTLEGLLAATVERFGYEAFSPRSFGLILRAASECGVNSQALADLCAAVHRAAGMPQDYSEPTEAAIGAVLKDDAWPSGRSNAQMFAAAQGYLVERAADEDPAIRAKVKTATATLARVNNLRLGDA